MTEPCPSHMMNLPWLAFHDIVNHLVDMLGFSKVIKLRVISRSFNQEIMDNLLSRCRKNALGHREPNNSGSGEIWAEFAYLPDHFMCDLLIYGLENFKLKDTALLQRIRSITNIICDTEGGRGLSPRLVQQSVCRALFARGQTLSLRSAIFKDEKPEISSVPVVLHAISVAAYMGNIVLLQHLAQGRLNIDWETDTTFFCRPLTAAAKAGHKDCCEMLIDYGADPNGMYERLLQQRKREKQGTGYSNSEAADDALRAACRSGNVSLVKHLFEFANSLGLAADYSDILVATAQSGRTQVLSYLFNKIDVDLHASNVGTRMLHAAAAAGHNPIVAMLLDAGVNIDSEETAHAGSALVKAARNGHERTVRFLLERKAAILNDRGRSYSALGGAASYGHLKTMETLLEYRAEINAARRREHLPMICAAENRQIEALQYLLKQGADINHQDCGIIALEDASRVGHEDIVRVLLEAGVNVNGDDRTSRARFGSPLLAAKIGGHAGLVKMLLEAGARDVDPLSTEYKDEFLNGKMPYPQRPEPLLRP